MALSGRMQFLIHPALDEVTHHGAHNAQDGADRLRLRFDRGPDRCLAVPDALRGRPGEPASNEVAREDRKWFDAIRDRLACGSRTRRRDGCLPNPSQQGRTHREPLTPLRKKVPEQFLGAGLPGKATVPFVDLNWRWHTRRRSLKGNDQQDCGTQTKVVARTSLDLRAAARPPKSDIGDFIGVSGSSAALKPNARVALTFPCSWSGCLRKPVVRFGQWSSFTSRAGDSSAAAPPSEPSPEGPVRHQHLPETRMR